jgi:DMSO/TMAO reductase YedYZ molybdopterin-dependent catalytic subunit
MQRFIFPVLVLLAVFTAASSTPAQQKEKLDPDTPTSKIVYMDPKLVDPSALPLTKTENLHTTGSPPDIDISSWKLEVGGKGVSRPIELGYEALGRMEQIKEKVLLICPGFFWDYAEWEGVPLKTVLDRARLRPDFRKVTVRSADGYRKSFSREQVEKNLLFLALKVNGEVLPEEHGFPVRLVAKDLLGDRWVKWIAEIEVE